MDKEIKAPEFEFLSFLPQNFFNKNVNEKFIKLVMKSIFNGEWKKGCEEKNEPDFICNGVPFEFTLASDKCNRKNKNNFIRRMKIGQYTSEDVEKDAFFYIEEQIKDKTTKKYSLKNVHLCVLCLLDRFDWISDEYGSYTHFLMDYQRENFFKHIKETYIETKKFSNIFLIFPDMTSYWWVWDVLSDKKVSLFVTPKMIESKNYPYWIEKNLYLNLVRDGLLKDVFSLLK